MPATDEAFMRAAFALARRGLGQTWPNPSVGAILVRPDAMGGEIVGRGWTAPGGRPHAERVTIDKAGEAANGCTLYVTLEPCSHHGKTPPCADAIIEAGIARVVCSACDPDPRVGGAGLCRLRQAGIEVIEAVLAEEGVRLARGHALRVTEKRPFVQLKLAVGSDGLIPQGSGAPVWATGEQARAHGHLLRARADAILTGRGTVAADDPELTCRLPGMAERSPVRVVLDSRLSLPPKAKLIATVKLAPLWVFGSHGANQDNAGKLDDAGAEVITVPPGGQGGVDLKSVLARLAQRSITRLLIEGGPRVAGSFWSANLVDEIYLYQGPEPVGTNGLKPFAAHGIETIEASLSFALKETRTLGRDKLKIYHRKGA